MNINDHHDARMGDMFEGSDNNNIRGGRGGERETIHRMQAHGDRKHIPDRTLPVQPIATAKLH